MIIYVTFPDGLIDGDTMATESFYSKLIGKDMFTDKGMYCGRVSDIEVDLQRFRVRALIVNAIKGSYLYDLVGGQKGVIIPYNMVKAVGDIVIIKHISPSPLEE